MRISDCVSPKQVQITQHGNKVSPKLTMADNGASANTAQMPPPQANAGAPGFEAGKNGQGAAPNQPPPLQIPTNNNPIPTSVTSPLSGVDGGILSPTSAARRAAPEPNKRALYVGGLDQRVTEDVLRQIFETTGHVQSVKIIPDKNVCLSGSCSSVEPELMRRTRPRDSIMDSWSTTTRVLQTAPCRL
jgi:hypothetical protein